jgi:hypothetical protein
VQDDCAGHVSFPTAQTEKEAKAKQEEAPDGRDQVNQGMVISIAKKFETEQAVPKKEEGSLI